ncbi:hypothetical protein [Bernardetia sp.]|uniref:hypothetical protein n=1 Tax=Bernardetia sp. TaxID=1937974 RepID=UPI0025BA4B83|nr:hypothetical protein [Bernardetia sp.]
MKNLILVLIILSSFSCANTKNSASNDTNNLKQDTPMNYETLAKKKLDVTETQAEGEKFECQENDKKTYVLCKKISKGTVKQPRNSISYAVYDMKTNELVYEGLVDGGHVKWYDTNRLEIYQQMGIPIEGMSQDDMIKIYDVVEKNTITKTEADKK